MADRPTRLHMAVQAVTALAAALLTPPARRRATARRDVERHAELRITEARKDKP
ncbi:hypothetical protein [Verrucosispora sp. WMMD1129]|uniref:hypothetical protein n=1 Tax=Verrucosispora sp. WMMD1129 TaxID=3016093 RepID=UPI00249AA8EC|nr:hypothetical protein [Verrucosispora sp. WMMD1129]WFE45333.1 hypothetical protein O7624_13710 [Verrucosispora sp. WMMD1129]